MKIVFVAVLILVACSMMTNAYRINKLGKQTWLKVIMEENAKTHCYDEYLKAAEKINSELMTAMNQCGVDNKSGREIIKCIHLVAQKAGNELFDAEQLICAE